MARGLRKREREGESLQEIYFLDSKFPGAEGVDRSLRLVKFSFQF